MNQDERINPQTGERVVDMPVANDPARRDSSSDPHGFGFDPSKVVIDPVERTAAPEAGWERPRSVQRVGNDGAIVTAEDMKAAIAQRNAELVRAMEEDGIALFVAQDKVVKESRAEIRAAELEHRAWREAHGYVLTDEPDEDSIELTGWSLPEGSPADCSECGTQVWDSWQFCPSCGASLGSP